MHNSVKNRYIFQQMPLDLKTDRSLICVHIMDIPLLLSPYLTAASVETMAWSHLSTVSKGMALSEED